MASEFIPAPMITEQHLAEVAQLASLSDETPEGRSIVVLAKEKYGFRAENLTPSQGRFIPFTAVSRMSGVDIFEDDGQVMMSVRKGMPRRSRSWVENEG